MYAKCAPDRKKGMSRRAAGAENPKETVIPLKITPATGSLVILARKRGGVTFWRETTTKRVAHTREVAGSNGMPPKVDVYNNSYGNYERDAYRDVRLETYGEDFGQTSWVSTEEPMEFRACWSWRRAARFWRSGPARVAMRCIWPRPLGARWLVST